MSSPNGFQNVVNNQPGVAGAGDFADAGLRANVITGPGALLAADIPNRPIVGNFAWANQLTNIAAANFHGLLAEKIGFVSHRANIANISKFLAASQLEIEAGLQVTLFDKGAFWALFPDGAAVNQKVFARVQDGSVYADDAGADTETASFTGVIAVTTGILTASAVTGTISAGDIISGTGVPSGTVVVAQLSGTPGGAGTYSTNITTAVASTAMTTDGSVETQFIVTSPADAGELAKISTWG